MKLLKPLLLNILIILLSILVLTIFYYYDIIKLNIYNILLLIIFIISTIITNYKLSKIKRKKEVPLIYSVLLILIFTITNILNKSLRPTLLILYLIIIISSYLGYKLVKKPLN